MISIITKKAFAIQNVRNIAKFSNSIEKVNFRTARDEADL